MWHQLACRVFHDRLDSRVYFRIRLVCIRLGWTGLDGALERVPLEYMELDYPARNLGRSVATCYPGVVVSGFSLAFLEHSDFLSFFSSFPHSYFGPRSTFGCGSPSWELPPRSTFSCTCVERAYDEEIYATLDSFIVYLLGRDSSHMTDVRKFCMQMKTLSKTAH
ncbi:hypothetical protein MPTK2_3g14710 [Marchantia polymorpha subsp. ruderalis]